MNASKLFVLLLLAVLSFTLFSTTSATLKKKTLKRWVEKRCSRWLKVACEYQTKCVKAGIQCKKHKTTRHCFRSKIVVKKVKTPVCLEFKMKKKSNDCNELVKVCTKSGFKTRVVKKRSCLKWKNRHDCVLAKRVCKLRKTVKRCFTVEPEFQLIGPKTCPKNADLVFDREGKIITRKCITRSSPKPAPIQYKSCRSSHDPHYQSFAGKNFDFHEAGDFLLAETSDGVFSVHQRLKSFGRYSTNVGFAVRPNAVDIIEFYQGHFKLNGRAFAILKNGQETKLKHGGSIKIKGNIIEVFGPNNAKLVVHDYNWFMNVFVFVPTTLMNGVKGVCTGEKPVRVAGLFSFQYRPEFSASAFPKKKFTARQTNNARVKCVAIGMKGTALEQCIKDMLNVGAAQRDATLKAEKDVKKDVKKGIKAKSRFIKAKIITKKAAPKKVVTKVIVKRKGKKIVKKIVKISGKKAVKQVKQVKAIAKKGRGKIVAAAKKRAVAEKKVKQINAVAKAGRRKIVQAAKRN